MKEYLKSEKIIEDLKECVEKLLKLCNSKRNKNICESMRDLNECRLFLEQELHKGDLSFNTYTIGSFNPESYYPELVSSYEDAAKRINLAFNKIKNEDDKAVKLLKGIVILMEKNPLCL
jgi:hypothetical protein